MQETKELVVKRVPRAGYFGINAYPKSTTSVGCQEGKNGFNTGLTSDEEREFESLLGLKVGELSKHNRKFWSDIFNVEYPIKLNNTKETRFILEDPINRLKAKVLKARSDIALSELEKNKPYVDFYIVDEEAKAKAESEIFDYEWEAMELLLKLSPEEKRASLRLFGKRGVESLSETVLKSELIKEIKKDPKAFCEVLKDKKLKTRLLLEELLDFKVIRRTGNYYIYGDDTIATTSEEAVEYLEDIKNQSIKLTMDNKLKKLKK